VRGDDVVFYKAVAPPEDVVFYKAVAPPLPKLFSKCISWTTGIVNKVLQFRPPSLNHSFIQ